MVGVTHINPEWFGCPMGSAWRWHNSKHTHDQWLQWIGQEEWAYAEWDSRWTGEAACDLGLLLAVSAMYIARNWYPGDIRDRFLPYRL